MAERKITLMGINPVHPGRGEPSSIELTLVLDYIKGTPVVSVPLTGKQALRLAEQAVMAVRVVTLKEEDR